MSWSALEALSVIKEAWSLCATAGYHIALTGSVLTQGSSDNDLDLVIYPKGGLHSDYRPAIGVLQHVLRASPPCVVERPDQVDYKLVITLVCPDKRRVEVFVPNFAFEGRLDKWELVSSGESSSEKP